MELNQYSDLCIKLLENHDNDWMIRKRKLDTLTIFESLIDSSITNTGVSTCVYSKNNFSHVAMHKARQKIGNNIFKDINHKIHDHIQEHI